MSTLLRADGVVEDRYLPVADEQPLPAQDPILVDLARWEQERERLAARHAPLGIRLPNTAVIADLDPAVLRADLIVLDFPSFGDGRAYSQARLLREARTYRGELRATGAAVVRDQLLGMVRCGIDSFLLREDQSVERCLQALRDFSVAYQPAHDGAPLVRRLRRAPAPN